MIMENKLLLINTILNRFMNLSANILNFQKTRQAKKVCKTTHPL